MEDSFHFLEPKIKQQSKIHCRLAVDKIAVKILRCKECLCLQGRIIQAMVFHVAFYESESWLACKHKMKRNSKTE